MEDTSKLKTFPFNERPAMKINVPGDADLIFFFGLMLTDDLVEDSVKKTNENVHKTINRNRPLRCRSTWNSWTDVTVDKMRKFIWLIFSMGQYLCHLIWSTGARICFLRWEKDWSPSCDFSLLVKNRSLKMIGWVGSGWYWIIWIRLCLMW